MYLALSYQESFSNLIFLTLSVLSFLTLANVIYTLPEIEVPAILLKNQGSRFFSDLHSFYGI